MTACEEEPDATRDPPHIGHGTVVQVLICATDGRLRAPLAVPGAGNAAFTSYIGIWGALEGGSITEPEPGRILIEPASGVFGAFGQRPGSRMADITDGTSQTIMVGERPPPDSFGAGRWYAAVHIPGTHFPGPDAAMLVPDADQQCLSFGPGFGRALGPGRTDNPCDRLHFWSFHPGGANFVFADGAVRYFSYSMADLLPALATRSGNERVELPF